MLSSLSLLSKLGRTAVRAIFPALLAAVTAGALAACSAEPTAAPTGAMPALAIVTASVAPTGVPTQAAPTAAPTSTPAPTATPEPTSTATTRPEGPLVSLPEDEAPHETPIEWWYFNGFLWDEDGNEFSFHYVTFQSPTLALGTPHLLHATFGAHANGEHFAGERPAFAVLDPDAPSVDIDADGWVMRGDGEGGYVLEFDLGSLSLELDAISTRAPVLHDSTGLVEMGEAGETYYYSRTRMQLDGRLEDASGQRTVSGSGWMDHQWGEISRVDVGWDWVNLQLDDGSDLMVAVVWMPQDPPESCADGPCPVQGDRVAAYATYVDPEGRLAHVPGEGIELEATGDWTSGETYISYPSGWRIGIEPLDIELSLAPVLPDAEFDAGDILPVVYWEGAVTAYGRNGDAEVQGRGFVELVGYDPNQATADIPAP